MTLKHILLKGLITIVNELKRDTIHYNRELDFSGDLTDELMDLERKKAEAYRHAQDEEELRGE